MYANLIGPLDLEPATVLDQFSKINPGEKHDNDTNLQRLIQGLSQTVPLKFRRKLAEQGFAWDNQKFNTIYPNQRAEGNMVQGLKLNTFLSLEPTISSWLGGVSSRLEDQPTVGRFFLATSPHRYQQRHIDRARAAYRNLSRAGIRFQKRHQAAITPLVQSGLAINTEDLQALALPDTTIAEANSD